mmetsp:Transcript_12657/g.18146  ORF Transcript_12657/g.18146 Transcript_12657/m.18146 type:complete len:196 (-) Transcript_12657:177-764(-)
MNLKPSFLLSAAFMPLVASQQSEFLSCVISNVVDGNITLGGDLTGLTDTVSSLCCPEDTTEATCAALNCIDLGTSSMVEPCTCGEAMGAQGAMKTDVVLSSQIAMMVPDLYPNTDAIFANCCPSENTTATEVNTCLATLPLPTTTVATEPAVAVETTTTATEAVPTPTTAPSSGSIVASVSLPVIVAYTLLNYVM